MLSDLSYRTPALLCFPLLYYFLNIFARLTLISVSLILAITPILDGNIELCKQLQYVKICPYKRHYNVLREILPRSTIIRGNELIEEWRRFE